MSYYICVATTPPRKHIRRPMSAGGEKKPKTEPEHDTNRISRQPDETESQVGEFFAPRDVNAWRRTSAQSQHFKRTQETLAMGEPHVSIQRNFELLEHYNLFAVKRVEAASSSMSSELLETICKGTKGNLMSLDLTSSRDDMKKMRHDSTSWITNELLRSIAKLCPKLKTLLIGQSCDKITDAGVIALAKGCRQLSSLNLSQTCVRDLYRRIRFTDAGVLALSRNCPQLSILNLSRCTGITDAGVIALAQGCRQLSSLNLKWCNKITAAGVIALARCPQLSSLDLEYCDQITDACVIALVQGCPQLSSLHLGLIGGVRVRVSWGSGGSSKSSRGSSGGGGSGGAASQVAGRLAPARRMRLSYRARF